MDSHRHVLYVLRDPDNGIPRYVGITALPVSRRFWSHVEREDCNGHKQNWINKLKRQGKLPTLEVVAVGLTPEEACDLEVFAIRSCRALGFPLVNLSAGGRLGALGVKRTEEQRKAMSERFKGANNPWWGKKFSPEHRRKIGAAQAGKKRRPEWGRKISQSKRGHAVSPETRAKISATLRGRPLSEEHRAKVSRGLKGRKFKNQMELFA